MAETNFVAFHSQKTQTKKSLLNSVNFVKVEFYWRSSWAPKARERSIHSLENLVNPSIREILLMMSPYESPSVRTDSGRGGGESSGNPNGEAQKALFLCQHTIAELT